jgi:hypothetical protein
VGAASGLARPERAEPSHFSELARWASRAELGSFPPLVLPMSPSSLAMYVFSLLLYLYIYCPYFLTIESPKSREN